ncbi:MAG: hypothetical protein ABSG86_14685 [Thermoguttaceae bacterium]
MTRETPPLVPKAILLQCLARIEEHAPLHNWEPEAVVKHFAFLLPEGQTFSRADAELVTRRLHLPHVPVEHLLHNLTYQAHALEYELLGVRDTFLSRVRLRAATWTHGYYMVKKARVGYAKAVAALGWGPEPERHGVSQRLAGLAPKLSDPQQKALLTETLDCLRIGANRAAIVMGWNLAFDHLRQWVCRRHLAEFNAKLTGRCEKKNRNYDPVVDADGFPRPEWLCLDVCREAGLLEGHELDILLDALKKRNRYAHPGSVVATAAIAAGHIEDLLEHVVLSAKFEW